MMIVKAIIWADQEGSHKSLHWLYNRSRVHWKDITQAVHWYMELARLYDIELYGDRYANR